MNTEGGTEGWILAIDFGTTNTSAATASGGRVELVEVDGAPRMPSVVLATESGGLVVGSAAVNQLGLTPERAETTPKRRIGDEVMLLGSRPVRPVDAVASIFGAIAAEAKRVQGGTPPSSLRLTHPARWGSVRLGVLAEAAQLAELPPPDFVPEPVAAAVHFADERVATGDHVAVYDLGGGTFDTAVLRRRNDGFEVVGPPGGDERLGGETFDARLWEHLGGRLAGRNPDAWESLRFETDRQWRKAAHDFRVEVRRAKEALSSNADYTIYLGAPVDIELFVTRDELESLIRADVDATVAELEATVARAGLANSDLVAINLVGGSSRIPLVTRVVSERFGRLPDTWGDPKAAVVLGALKAAPGSIRSTNPVATPTGPAAPPRSHIGGYELLTELGRGGMGVVYLARQPSLGRLVALKTLPTLDAALTARLEREASVLAELQHPHVAAVLDIGSDEGATYVVMPFFGGGTLAQVVDARGPLPAGEVTGAVAAVAEALAATHSRGFLHRDVKPSNILLSADGDCYLADFGLAFPLQDSSRLTNSKAILGTVPYTAPEVIADAPASPASDVYALGVTAYQLLTGTLPFSGSNVIAVIDAVRRAEPRPLAELAPAAPPALIELVEAAMAADPQARPTDLRAFATALRACADPVAVVPAPPARWARAAEVTVGADATGAPVADSPIQTTVPASPTARTVELAGDDTGHRRRHRRPLLAVLSAAAVVAIGLVAWASGRDGERPPERVQVAGAVHEAETEDTTTIPSADATGEVAADPAAAATGEPAAAGSGTGAATNGVAGGSVASTGSGAGSSGASRPTSSGGGSSPADAGGSSPGDTGGSSPDDTSGASGGTDTNTGTNTGTNTDAGTGTTTTTSTTTTTTTTSPPVPAGLSTEERRIALLIPNDTIRMTCKRTSGWGAGDPGFLASLMCTASTGTFYAESYATGADTTSAFNRMNPLEPDPTQTSSGCSTTVFHYEGTYNSNGSEDGKLRCALDSSKAAIYWTDTSQRVLGWVWRYDRNSAALFNDWVSGMMGFTG